MVFDNGASFSAAACSQKYWDEQTQIKANLAAQMYEQQRNGLRGAIGDEQCCDVPHEPERPILKEAERIYANIRSASELLENIERVLFGPALNNKQPDYVTSDVNSAIRSANAEADRHVRRLSLLLQRMGA